MPADGRGRLWRRVAAAMFFAAVAALLWRFGRGLDWAQVGASLRAQSPAMLMLAALPALASHALYASFDLVGRHETGHGLRPRQVLAIGHISYAFNLNLGSLVGGVAFRYRLYSRHGLRIATITRVLVLSLLTNWSGWLALAGAVFVLRPPPLPEGWKLGGEALPALGAAMLALAAAYLVAAAVSPRRRWVLSGHEVELPHGRVALWQLAVSTASWALIAATVWVLLGRRIDYPSVLATMLLAAIAGVVAHVPAGLGVLEAVCVALLSHRLPAHEIVGALLAYRALYYLLPLATATALFASVEWRRRRGRRAGTGLADPRAHRPTEEILR